MFILVLYVLALGAPLYLYGIGVSVQRWRSYKQRKASAGRRLHKARRLSSRNFDAQVMALQAQFIVAPHIAMCEANAMLTAPAADDICAPPALVEEELLPFDVAMAELVARNGHTHSLRH